MGLRRDITSPGAEEGLAGGVAVGACEERSVLDVSTVATGASGVRLGSFLGRLVVRGCPRNGWWRSLVNAAWVARRGSDCAPSPDQDGR